MEFGVIDNESFEQGFLLKNEVTLKYIITCKNFF